MNSHSKPYYIAGYKGGACYYLEFFMQRNLSRAFCLIHFGELPMRIFKTHFIGKTKGPGSRDGDLGEQLSKLRSNQKEMVEFIPIKGKVEEIDAELLENSDQKYAFHMAMGIQKGYAYLLEKFGKIPPLPANTHHARFLNDFSHFMREYVQNPNPPEELRRLIEIGLNWYLPFFFLNKKNWQIKHAAKNFHQGLVWNRECFTTEEQELVEKCFRMNSFMAHPESILIAGVCDPDMAIRKFCAEKIIEARQRDDGELRQYLPPNHLLEFDSESYLDMVDLRLKSYVTAPPLLKNYDDDTLMDLAIEGKIEIPDIPCHSVNCERAVKDTSKASMEAIGIEQTHGHILNMNENRSKIPTRHKKSDFQ